MRKESAKKFLQRTQPDAWEGAYKSAVRLARQMAPMTWEQRASLFNDVLGIIAEVTNGSPRRLVQGEVSSREGGPKQFVAGASALLAGLLLELAQAHGAPRLPIAPCCSRPAP
jgi:hypothetical protein